MTFVLQWYDTRIAMLEEDALDNMTPMEVAQLFVRTRRAMAEHDLALDALKKVATECNERLLVFMEAGQWPEKATVDGATVFLQSQVWASARDGNHKRLAEALEQIGLVEYLPTTVNSQSISAYVRERLDPDKTKPIEQRLDALDPRLVDALKITEKHIVKPSGL